MINCVKKEEIRKLIPPRIRDSHKGTYGRVALLGGAIEYSGAIRLASMALSALKAGAGLSTLAVPRFLVPLISANILEVMLYPIESNDKEIIYDKDNIDGLIKKVDVLTCGMGLGRSDAAHKIIYHIINEFDGKLTLDADAINIVSENIDILNNAKSKILLTPHMMEFKRLFDSFDKKEHSLEDIEKNKLDYAKRFVDKYNVVLLLKGPVTMVISKERGPAYIDRGTPGMATAGSGDVLSGIVTGFLGYIDDIFDASVVSAYINGMAGEYAASEVGEISMLSSDTVRMIPKAIREVMN